MIGRAISHLVPSVQAMAVCAQQAKVSFVGGPITKAVIPDGGSALVAQFLRWVDVVNVEDAVVSFPALNARAAQFGNQGKLARPIARVFVFGEAVLVPVILTTLHRTKAMLTFVAAAFAPAFALPPRLKVAGSAAILPGAVFDAILMSFERLLAIAASHLDSRLFHRLNIVAHNAHCNFDIACRRIDDAQRQGDFFVESAA